MTCIGGRRPVRILRGDCIIIGYADTASPNGGVSLLLFPPSPPTLSLTFGSRASIRL